MSNEYLHNLSSFLFSYSFHPGLFLSSYSFFKLFFFLQLREREREREPVNDSKVPEIRTPTLFLGIGTPNRRANVGVMSTWITNQMQVILRYYNLEMQLSVKQFEIQVLEHLLHQNKQRKQFKRTIKYELPEKLC